MPQVIEWVNPREDEIVWKYPSEEIEWGSQLIVKEYEAAVFFRDGKAYDVFGPGRHTLTTLNLPLLTRVLSKYAGFDRVPFRATVYFVSLKQFQGKFGGRTQTKELAPLMFHGTFWFRVGDPKLFIVEVVGGQGIYETQDLSKFLRGYFNENLMKYLSTYSIVDVYRNLDKVSTEIKVKLLQDFRRIGLELIDMKFEGIDTTEEWRNKVFWLMQTGQATYVLQMETAREVAKELGKSPGAAVGAGIAIIPPLFTPPPAPSTTAPPTAPPTPPTTAPPTTPPSGTGGIRCPKCGTINPPGAKYCMKCGTPLFKKCPNGHEVPLDAVFCPYCGHKFTS